MAIQSSEAIILKRIPLGDTSLLVTVYSRNFGKVKLVARGARGPLRRRPCGECATGPGRRRQPRPT